MSDSLPPEKYSILIPSWNNIPYLKKCIQSLRTYSSYPHQIIVLLNEGKDGSLAWIEKEASEDPHLQFVYSPTNLGICFGLNRCRHLVRTPYMVYMNDDMVVLPEWDHYLEQARLEIGHDKYCLSGTMIEPVLTQNPCVLVRDYGSDIESFQEDALIKDFRMWEKPDWSGSTWPPILLPTELWDLVGGMSVEFHPGWYSDPDLSMKLWQAGVRYFKGVGAARIYHFGSKSTKRVPKTKEKKLFLRKWGITPRFFTEHYLKRGQPFTGPLPEMNPDFFQRMVHAFKLYL